VRAVVAFVALAATLGAAGASAAPPASRALIAPLPVQDLALAGRSIAYVADVPRVLRCSRIGYWNTGTRRAFTFDSQELCGDEASTGQGVWNVSVATNRFLWITYTGGNVREWFLWTATTTRKTPRQLRFGSRPVEDPPPVVVGPGTPQGIPYAADREIVYLGNSGRALFKTTVDSPVRLLAAGPGPTGCEVAAFLANGWLRCLDSAGKETPLERYPPTSVEAIRVGSFGVAVEVAGQVELLRPRSHEGPIVTIPLNATMVDVAQGRILWERAGDLGATTIATGRSTLLVDGSPARPVHGTLEPAGLAWAQGRALRWRAGPLP